MYVFLGVLFPVDEALNEIGVQITGGAGRYANQDCYDECRVVDLAGGRCETSFCQVASFCFFIPGGDKIGSADTKVRGEYDLVILHGASLLRYSWRNGWRVPHPSPWDAINRVPIDIKLRPFAALACVWARP